MPHIATLLFGASNLLVMSSLLAIGLLSIHCNSVCTLWRFVSTFNDWRVELIVDICLIAASLAHIIILMTTYITAFIGAMSYEATPAGESRVFLRKSPISGARFAVIAIVIDLSIVMTYFAGWIAWGILTGSSEITFKTFGIGSVGVLFALFACVCMPRLIS